MVPLDRAAFIESLSADPVVRTFASVMFNGEAVPPQAVGLSARGRITLDALRSLVTGDQAFFGRAYAEIRTRRIADDADWVYDDYLIFSLCAGVRRFSGEPGFLRQVLDERRKIQTNAEDRELIDEFAKLLDRGHKPAGSPVLVVGRFFADDLGHATEELVSAYQWAIKSLARPNAGEFSRIVSTKAVDVVIECLPISAAIPSVFLRHFEWRARQIAIGVHATLCGTALLVWCYLGGYYLFGSGTGADLAEKLFSMSLVIAPSAVLFARKTVVFAVQRFLTRFWGGAEAAGKFKPPTD